MSTPDEPTVRLPPPAKNRPPARPPSAPPPAQRPVARKFRSLQRRTPAPPSTAPTKRRWFKRRKPRVTLPTQAELDKLPVDKRQELFDAQRQRSWQHLTSLGVLIGLIFTGGGLIYT